MLIHIVKESLNFGHTEADSADEQKTDRDEWVAGFVWAHQMSEELGLCVNQSTVHLWNLWHLPWQKDPWKVITHWEQMMTHCIITQLYNYIVYYTNYESWIMVIYLCIPIVYWFVMYNHYCANQFLLGNPPQRRRSPMHIACSETRRLSETRSSPGIISPRSGCETFVVWWLYRVIPHRIHVCYIW